MRVLQNENFGLGDWLDLREPSLTVGDSLGAIRRLLSLCPKANETPLIMNEKLSQQCDVAEVWVKDERKRMGMGSFKALGAAYVIAQQAMDRSEPDIRMALKGVTYVTASAGNHGLSVAAGARVFGAESVVFLPKSVPDVFVARLSEFGARVVRCSGAYESSMSEARIASEKNGWVFLSDSSWPGYTEIPRQVMEGYFVMVAEATDMLQKLGKRPTHIFVQAGVGGMAAAVATYTRYVWGQSTQIIVVEPESAAALMESVRNGRVTRTDGPVSTMGRLDCKEPSFIALRTLAHEANVFLTIDDNEAISAMPVLAASGLQTTTSGGAGVAALILAGGNRAELNITQESQILTFVTEGADN